MSVYFIKSARAEKKKPKHYLVLLFGLVGYIFSFTYLS